MLLAKPMSACLQVFAVLPECPLGISGSMDQNETDLSTPFPHHTACETFLLCPLLAPLSPPLPGFIRLPSANSASSFFTPSFHLNTAFVIHTLDGILDITRGSPVQFHIVIVLASATWIPCAEASLSPVSKPKRKNSPRFFPFPKSPQPVIKKSIPSLKPFLEILLFLLFFFSLSYLPFSLPPHLHEMSSAMRSSLEAMNQSPEL